MATDKIRKYVLPNIPYLFIGWFCLKIGTAYRLAAGAGFGEKLLGLGQTIGAAFAAIAFFQTMLVMCKEYKEQEGKK